MKRLYLETLQSATPREARRMLDASAAEWHRAWTQGPREHLSRTEYRRRYIRAVKRLDRLLVALGGTAGTFRPLDPDARPMRLDR